MTLYVRDRRDLRARWDSLLFVEKAVNMAMAQGLSIDGTKAKAFINDLKQAIRAYNRRKSDRRIISGDYDGYIELIEVPQGITDVDAWFDDNERLICTPSIYDCTGQAFTMWYKAVNRGGKWFVYHKVGFDV